MRIEIEIENENGISFSSDNFPVPVNTVAKNEYHNLGRMLTNGEDLVVTICYKSLKEELHVPVKVLDHGYFDQVVRIVIDGIVKYEKSEPETTGTSEESLYGEI